MTKKEFTIGIDEEYYNLLDAEIKKLGFNSKFEFYNFLTKQYFTGGSINPELTVKQQTEKIKLEILEIRKKGEPDKLDLARIKKLNGTLDLWGKLKPKGYSLDQVQTSVDSGKLPEPENTFYETHKEVSKQFPSYGTTITHRPDKIKQEDGTLRCKHCNKSIPMRAYDFQQLDDYRNHVESVHDGLDDDEREELMGLYK